MKKRSNQLLALLLSAAIFVPQVGTAMPVYAEDMQTDDSYGGGASI